MKDGARKGFADRLSFGCGCALAIILAAIGAGILVYLASSSP